MKNFDRIRSLLLVVTGILFFSGCASTDKYVAFANTGSAYASAIDATLVAANRIATDSDSELLIATNRTQRSADFDAERCPHKAGKTTIKLDGFSEITCEDLHRRAIFSGLRKHAGLLSRYFAAVAALASSDAPERAQTAVEAASKQVETAGVELQRLQPTEIGQIAQIAVNARIRGVLRKELVKREATIRKELTLQGELLAALSKSLQTDLEVAFNDRLNRLVIKPYMAGIPEGKADKWIANRRSILESTQILSELQTASSQAKRLKGTFEALLNNEDVIGTLQQITADLNTLVAVIQMANN